jgi:hypothetical protein
VSTGGAKFSVLRDTPTPRSIRWRETRGGSDIGERGAPGRGTPLAVASPECSPSLSWACRQSRGRATSPLARWGLSPRPMVAELAEATTSPPLHSLPGHRPAAYPLDGCASRELRDLVGSPTRAHPRSVSSTPQPASLSPPPSHLPHLVARRWAELGGRGDDVIARLPPKMKETGRRVRPLTGATAAAPAQVVGSTFLGASSSGRASTSL